MLKLQNAIIHKLVKDIGINRSKLQPGDLAQVWKNTAMDSQIRRLLLHYCAWMMDTGLFTGPGNDAVFTRVVLLDLAVYASRHLDPHDRHTRIHRPALSAKDYLVKE
jgi:hypothetical protein